MYHPIYLVFNQGIDCDVAANVGLGCQLVSTDNTRQINTVSSHELTSTDNDPVLLPAYTRGYVSFTSGFTSALCYSYLETMH